MDLLVDTNRYADFIRGEVEVVERFNAADRLFLPLIAVGELLAGFAIGKGLALNEEKLQAFLHLPKVQLLLPNLDTALRYAEISSQLRRIGRPIPTNDIWIAAIAIQHNLKLDTRDSHFGDVAGLQLVNKP